MLRYCSPSDEGYDVFTTALSSSSLPASMRPTAICESIITNKPHANPSPQDCELNYKQMLMIWSARHYVLIKDGALPSVIPRSGRMPSKYYYSKLTGPHACFTNGRKEMPAETVSGV